MTSSGFGSESPRSVSIAADHVVELRRLAHDLSNALEIAIQASYLLGTTKIEEPAQPWMEMLQQGLERAAHINLQLREYIRQNSC